MSKTKSRSAGLLLFRVRNQVLEVFIGHMGGPFWAKKDEAGWSMPKGEYQEPEDPLLAAQREFQEEVGCPPPDGALLELGELRQPSGKRIVAWAIEGDLDPRKVSSNTFSMEWPPKSGQQAEFPEIDRADWFDIETARRKLVRGQAPFLELLEKSITALGRDVRLRQSAAGQDSGSDPGASGRYSASVQEALF